MNQRLIFNYRFALLFYKTVYLQKRIKRIMKCKYCHQSAGFFSFKHKECEQKHLESMNEIKNVILEKLSYSSCVEYDSLKDELSMIISSGFITEKDFDKNVNNLLNELLKNLVPSVDGFALKTFINSLPVKLRKNITNTEYYKDFWANFFKLYYLDGGDNRIDDYKELMQSIKDNKIISTRIDKTLISVLETKILDFLSDGIIDYEEEKEVDRYLENTNLSQSDLLQDSNAFHKFMQSLILRDIQEGKEVTRLQVDKLPILLGKKEQLLWIFKNVQGYEEKTGRKYVGGSRGVSMKVCKGVYYRVGASRGHSVEYQYQKDLGKGVFIVTNKNMYFIGVHQVKMGFSKVLSFEPYSDGLLLVKDGATPKPYTFIGFDSWFVVNAMQLLVN